MEHRRKHLKNSYVLPLWSVDFNKNHFLSQHSTFSSPSQHLLEILSSLLPFTRNLPFIRRPNSCIVVWQQLICWLASLASLLLFPAGYLVLVNTGFLVDTQVPRPLSFICGVSLLTMTAISVDRLLALLLGLRYRHIVTLKRTYIVVVTFWVLSSVAALCYKLDHRITAWYGLTVVPLCYVISIVSFTKIFCALSHHYAQIRDHVQQPNQPNAVNTTIYKKAVYNALWVQLALVVCYLPYGLLEIVIRQSKTYSWYLVIMRGAAGTSTFLNSTLNPFLYCWKISEVRQAVKQTIREAFSCQ